MLDIQKFIGSPKIVTEQLDDRTTSFSIQYLPRWFGYTLGNAIRRAVLWYSAWWAITAIKIKWIAHEYDAIDWIKETVLQIMANFKQLKFSVDQNIEQTLRITQTFKWGWVVSWKDCSLPAGVDLVTPDAHLMTFANDDVEITVEMRVEKWYWYYSLDFLRGRDEKVESTDINLLLIDNDFKVVEYVKYAIEDVIDDFSWGSKDKLILEVKTISEHVNPKEILSFAGEVLSSYARLFIFDDAYIDSSLLVDYYDIVEKNEKEAEASPVKTIPIDALPLSERTRNALIKNEILYVEDLEKKRKSELLTMKWIWKKAVDEIIWSLENMWKNLEG